MNYLGMKGTVVAYYSNSYLEGSKNHCWDDIQ